MHIWREKCFSASIPTIQKAIIGDTGWVMSVYIRPETQNRKYQDAKGGAGKINVSVYPT